MERFPPLYFSCLRVPLVNDRGKRVVKVYSSSGVLKSSNATVINIKLQVKILHSKLSNRKHLNNKSILYAELVILPQ